MHLLCLFHVNIKGYVWEKIGWTYGEGRDRNDDVRPMKVVSEEE